MATASAGGAIASNEIESALISAKRALPISRMIDYGMASDDAARVHGLAPESGLSWDRFAASLGEFRVEQAKLHADGGRHAMAMLELERASAAFNIAQLSFHRDTQAKRALYARATACLTANAVNGKAGYVRLALSAQGDGTLYGWHFQVADPVGTVVMFGGLSGWGGSFLGLARALAAKGIATILAEAPGQGETRMISGLHLSRAALTDAMRFVDFADESDRPVGLVGFSYGGLIAAHLAAAASHVAALCTNGSPAAIGELAHPAENEQFGAAFGAEGDRLRGLITDFNFDHRREILRCPVLSLEGGADPLVAPGTCRGFVGDRHTTQTSIIWQDGLHTLYNHAAERNALISAWLFDCFVNSKGD